MRLLLALSIAISGSAAAQTAPVASPTWQPSAAYVTAGQDEPGYRSWYLSSPAHKIAVTNFNNYLLTYRVSNILPTWQLLRTASSWQRCGAQPFEVPPVEEWPNIVQTLRYINDDVVPAVGPVEAVSAYRNPSLNVCAGGAPASAHRHYSAIDMVPLRPMTREQLMATLCRAHARRGPDYGVGLGFYAFMRFHVDTTKFRRWGADAGSNSCPPIVRADDVATVYQPPAPVVLVPPVAPAPSDPLAAKPPGEPVVPQAEPPLPPKQ